MALIDMAVSMVCRVKEEHMIYADVMTTFVYETNILWSKWNITLIPLTLFRKNIAKPHCKVTFFAFW